MTNHDFWMSISDIINEGFTSEGLAKLDDYAEQFSTGKILYKRFSPSEQLGCVKGGTIHVIASLLAGAEVGTDQLTAPEGSFKREQQLGKIQEKRIEDWAKTIGCWVDKVDKTFEQTFGEQLAEGGEAHVYDNGNTIIKRIGLDYYILPELALDRITLHNTLLPATRLTVLGFGRTTENDFQIIVQQPFIHGTSLADDEIRNYIESLGFFSYCILYRLFR